MIGKFKMKDLCSYMQDVHGIDGNEWPCKVDLISDIRSYGWEQDCIDYLS